jgi:glycosyltransferase involved in cell wall biosynthesis
VHVLYFNLLMDAEDPVLGFASRWVEAIAERVDRVTVVTMSAGRVAVPANVRVWSVGRERGLSEPARAALFYRWCLRVLRDDPPDVCFSHMIPIFSALFAPLARAYRVPSLLWYAHGAVPPELRVAERLVDGCVTSTPEGFRLPSSRLEVLHQGIDVAALRPPAEPEEAWARTVVMLGRISPVKRVRESVQAVARAREGGLDVRLEVFGAPGAEDRAYEQEVHEIAGRLLPPGVATFHGPIRHAEVGEALRRGGCFLNLSRSGSLDKAILEAMASGCIPVCDNDAFAGLARRVGWEALVPGEGVDTAAATLRVVVGGGTGAANSALRAELRDFVAAEHSLDVLADTIVDRLTALAGRAAQTGPIR